MFKQNRCSCWYLCRKVFALALFSVGANLNQVSAQTNTPTSTTQTTTQEDRVSRPNSESLPAKKQIEPNRSYFGRQEHSGDQVAGDSRSICNSEEANLSSLTPVSGLSKTVLSHPNWWFYFPSRFMPTREIEFVLQDLAGKDIVRESLSVSHDSDYFNIQLPVEYSGLKPNAQYVWFLKLYCSPQREGVPLYVSGRVERVAIQNKALSAETFDFFTSQQYIKQDLWLDVVDFLFQNQPTTDNHIHWLESWQEIIKSPPIGLELPPPK